MLFSTDSVFDPAIVRRGDEAHLEVFIAGTHADDVLEFPLTEAQQAVLRGDPERYYFLYGLLCARYGGAGGFDSEGLSHALRPEELGGLFDTALFGPPRELEPLLAEVDSASGGIVSHTIHLHTGVPFERFRSGRWFGAGISGYGRDSRDTP